MNLLRRTSCPFGIGVVSCILVITTQVLAGPYEDGVAAYDQGRFAIAYTLWLPLAEQGHAAAQFNIGVLFEKGQGVARDNAEAASWYMKAAEQEDVEAQYNVALLYERGAGFPRDLDKARYWYGKVVANAHTDPGTLDTKRRAEKKLANLSLPEEFIEYEGGRFALRRSAEGGCVVALQGFVSRDASFRFGDAVTKATELGCSRPLLLLLESPGGGLSDGIALGRKVRQEGFRTVARYDCSSACSMIFLGGVERGLVGSRARIGFHQAALIDRTSRKSCEESRFSTAALEIRHYLRYAIPANADRIFDIVMGTSCNSIEYVYGPRALELGVATTIEAQEVDMFGPKANR